MSAATDALMEQIRVHSERGQYRPGWIGERVHAAERAVLLEALVAVEQAELDRVNSGIANLFRKMSRERGR